MRTIIFDRTVTFKGSDRVAKCFFARDVEHNTSPTEEDIMAALYSATKDVSINEAFTHEIDTITLIYRGEW